MNNPMNHCHAAQMPRAERPCPMPVPPNDGCKPGSGCAAVMGQPLAMAYVAMQTFEHLYTPDAALCAGTLFADLDKPFCGEAVSGSAYPMAPARTCTGMHCDRGSGSMMTGKTQINPANACGKYGKGGGCRG